MERDTSSAVVAAGIEHGIIPAVQPSLMDKEKVARCMSWHLITPEYPPNGGGVGDYTRLVARGLTQTQASVHVWCASASQAPATDSDFTVQDSLGSMGCRDLLRFGAILRSFPGKHRLLVQWVPHGYGCRSMNIFFCAWLLQRAVIHRDVVELMVHEPFMSFEKGSIRKNIPAAVHRFMMILLLQSTRKVWVSTDAWINAIRPYALGRRISFNSLPVPSNIPEIADAAVSERLRQRLAHGGLLIGHFGTFGQLITDLLDDLIPIALQKVPESTVILIGPGGEAYREKITRLHPELSGRVHSTGHLDASDVSIYLSACDVLLQPYPDGVTTRRGSVMAALGHGRAIITTSGRLTEPFWMESSALMLHAPNDLQAFTGILEWLASNPRDRELLGKRAKAFYEDRFDISRTIQSLLQN